jgi:hypothetical protein
VLRWVPQRICASKRANEALAALEHGARKAKQ